MSDAVPHLSLVIPAFNEEGRLGPTLERVLTFFQERPYATEVIVVSDGSQDATCRVAESAFAALPAGGNVQARVLEYQPNSGKGRAVRIGVRATTGRFVAFTDADLSTPIEEVDRALRRVEDGTHMLVIGSRAVEGAAVERSQPLYRRLSARFFNVCRDGIAGLRGLKDTQCGLKVFDGPVARFIFARQIVDGFMFDVETMFVAQRLGLPILELGVRWADSPDSRVKLSSGLRMVPDLLRIRFAHSGLSRADLPPLAATSRATSAAQPVAASR